MRPRLRSWLWIVGLRRLWRRFRRAGSCGPRSTRRVWVRGLGRLWSWLRARICRPRAAARRVWVPWLGVSRLGRLWSWPRCWLRRRRAGLRSRLRLVWFGGRFRLWPRRRPISRRIRRRIRRAMGRRTLLVRRPVVRRMIVPIAAVARTAVIWHRPRAVPVVRRTIGISPSYPDRVVVISAVRTPVPPPATPSPGLVIGDQRADCDSSPKTDQRSSNHGTGARLDINDGRIILRHINYLRIRRLNYIDGLTSLLLYFHLLLRICAQRARRIGLGAQPLNRSRDGCLICGECLSNGGVIVNVLRHHIQHGRKIYQRDKRRIESRLLRRIGQRGTCHAGIVLKPVGNIQNFLRIGGRRGDLRKKGIGIQSYRGQQLI